MLTATAGLVVAGYFAGLIGFVTGLASIVSYPALLAFGVPPVAANVTNTVALMGVGIGSTANAAGALDGRGRELHRWVALCAIGGALGAVLLLAAPAQVFESVVPFLIAASGVALLLAPQARRLVGGRDRPMLLATGMFLFAIYTGYFGAGAGVMFLAALLIARPEVLWRATVLKSFLLGVANLIATIIFAATGPVHWAAALAMGVGALLGGWHGPRVVRFLPERPLRIAIGIAALGLAVWLGFKG